MDVSKSRLVTGEPHSPENTLIPSTSDLRQNVTPCPKFILCPDSLPPSRPERKQGPRLAPYSSGEDGTSGTPSERGRGGSGTRRKRRGRTGHTSPVRTTLKVPEVPVGTGQRRHCVWQEPSSPYRTGVLETSGGKSRASVRGFGLRRLKGGVVYTRVEGPEDPDH